VAILLSLFLMSLSAFTHYEVLAHLNERLPTVRWVSRRAKVLVVILTAILSHALHILFYATAYYLLRDGFRTGSLGGVFQDMFSTFFYFSAETYTSLGLGDIFPLGSLRVMVGFETLTGLLMISWTASFTYFEMSRYWRQPESSEA
jgi:hypothetical protein